MLIRVIPETDAEKATIREVEYPGVIEFFIFGNRKDEEGQVVDFHNWRGNYRYLIGSIEYFFEVLNDERRSAAEEEKRARVGRPPMMMKKVVNENPELKVVEVDKNEEVQEAQVQEAQVQEVEEGVPAPGFELIDEKKE